MTARAEVLTEAGGAVGLAPCRPAGTHQDTKDILFDFLLFFAQTDQLKPH